MTITEAQQQLTASLQNLYDNREAANIADWVMEHVTGMRKIDRIMYKQQPMPPEQLTQIQQYTQELLAHKPVQYVLHEAWFYGMAFYVDEHVLIPRPETEELVEWVLATGNRQSAIGNTSLSILDIGTGSGCIPISLKKKLPQATVYACDVSEQALAVATKNAATQQTVVQFLQADFLNTESWPTLPDVDVIVSNPPYIPHHNQSSMLQNVLAWEPHLALFVPNDNALVFYDAIARFAKGKLRPGGSIFVEIHEDLGPQTKAFFEANGFTASIKKDLQGKDRMVKASS